MAIGVLNYFGKKIQREQKINPQLQTYGPMVRAVPQTQPVEEKPMLPKDLLADLEKGDRTMEIIAEINFGNTITQVAGWWANDILLARNSIVAIRQSSAPLGVTGGLGGAIGVGQIASI